MISSRWIERPGHGHDQAAFGDRAQSREGALDFVGIAHLDRTQLRADRWGERTGSAPIVRSRHRDAGFTAAPPRASRRGATSLSSSSHFSAQARIRTEVNPVALPPGRARLATKPSRRGRRLCEHDRHGAGRLRCRANVVAPTRRDDHGDAARPVPPHLSQALGIAAAPAVDRSARLRPTAQPSS